MVWLKRDSLTPAPKRTAIKWGPVAAVPAAPQPSPDVLTKLRGVIEAGHFAVGAKLPPERTMAAELGVGRPALREAIKVLCGLGVLESRRGSGTYLKSASAAPESTPVPFDAGTEEFGVLDLLEVRKIVEPRAAWLAATRASERQLMAIENARLRLEMHDRDWKMVAKLDYELHAAIFKGANNPALQHIYEFLVSRIMRSPSERLRFPLDVQAMREGHRAVVEAILKRQPDAAERAMTDHLHSTGMNLIREGSH